MTDAASIAAELKPCPFCGGSDIRIDHHLGAGRGMLHAGEDVWSMCCYKCGASFPNRYQRKHLVAAWNRRPTPEPQPDLDALAALLAKQVETVRAWYSYIMTHDLDMSADAPDDDLETAANLIAGFSGSLLADARKGRDADRLAERVKVLEALLGEIVPSRLIGESHVPYPEGRTTVLMDWAWLKRARAALGGEHE